MSLPTPSLEATALIEELTSRGVALYASGDGLKLRFKPRSQVSPEEVAQLKEHKAEILEMVRTPDSASPCVPCVPTPLNADKYGVSEGDALGDAGEEECVPQWILEDDKRRTREAQALGLVSRWSREFGYIAIHDPTTGEWHDVATEDAPDWAKREAFKRKDLKKLKGITRLLTQSEVEVLYQEERVEMWEDPYRPHDACAGLVYDSVEEDS
jgi:hypothetical protein